MTVDDYQFFNKIFNKIKETTSYLLTLGLECDSLRVSAHAYLAADPGSNPAQGDDFFKEMFSIFTIEGRFQIKSYLKKKTTGFAVENLPPTLFLLIIFLEINNDVKRWLMWLKYYPNHDLLRDKNNWAFLPDGRLAISSKGSLSISLSLTHTHTHTRTQTHTHTLYLLSFLAPMLIIDYKIPKVDLVTRK